MNALSIIRMSLLLSVVSVFLTADVSASAAAANANISCRSVSSKGGAIHITGSIPGDFPEFELSLKRNSAETKMNSTGNDQILVVDDFANKIFTMVVFGKAGRLILYGIPRTIVATGDRHTDFKARFSAILSESPGSDNSSKARMTCTYEYSI